MKKIFAAIGHFFAMIFGDVEKEILDHLDAAIAITQTIKGILINPITEFALSMIPGTVGTFIKENEQKVTDALDQAITLLTEGQVCSQLATAALKVDCFIKNIAKLNVVQQHALLLKLASLISAQLEGNQHSESDNDTAVQMRFKQLQLDSAT